MRQARVGALGGQAHVAVLLADQADFGAAPGRPELIRFDDVRRASRVSRPSPTPFRAVDLDLQTKRARHQEIHPLRKYLHSYLACRKTSQKPVAQSDTVQRPFGGAND